MSPKDQKILIELAHRPIHASVAWWVHGKTDALLRMEDRGLVICVDRRGIPVHPTDDLAMWKITVLGIEEIQNIV